MNIRVYKINNFTKAVLHSRIIRKIVCLCFVFLVIGAGLGTDAKVSAAQTEDTGLESIVALLGKLKVMNGDPNGSFRMNEYVSRAEFAKVAVAMSSYKDSVSIALNVSPFKDVRGKYWGAGYIKVAVDNGFCNGYEDASFRPEDVVLYEEALAIVLRVLGYTDDDFGSSWPYGPIYLAETLGIADKFSHLSAGSFMSRKDVAVLAAETLSTSRKEGGSNQAGVFSAQLTEGTTVLSFDGESVYTTSGAYSRTEGFSSASVGQKGTLFVKNGDFLGFVPDDIGDENLEKYVVYTLLDNAVIGYKNGSLIEIEVSGGTTAYRNGNKSSYSALRNEVMIGDVAYIKKVGSVVDYVSFEKGNVLGPQTVTSMEVISSYASQVTDIVKNGRKADFSEINLLDVFYFIPDVGLALVYDNKVTGIYEDATPNKDMISSATVSGNSYALKGAEAINKLRSGGIYNFGDTVTLLRGMNNLVVDVISPVSSSVYGYLKAAGSKEYTRSDGSSYHSQYITVVLPDGSSSEYQVDSNYDSYLNSVVKVSFEGGTAKMSGASGRQGVSGKVSLADRTIGSSKVVGDVEIIDVFGSNILEPVYSKIFLNRLDGLSLSEDDILYAEKNSSGEITGLILNNVTGDIFSYGVVTKAGTSGYSYDVSGVSKSVLSRDTVYSVETGQGVKILAGKGGSIDMEGLKSLNNVNIKSKLLLSCNGEDYAISDRASAYIQDMNGYTLTDVEDLISMTDVTVRAYYDSLPENGGRVRVIIANKM